MKLQCDITLPVSKSESNRALMIAAYGGFEPVLQNLSDSNDTKVLNKALQRLPSIDSSFPTSLRRKCFAFDEVNDIEGRLQTINIADCGTAARFLTTYLACHEGEWLLTGTQRMRHRPMAPLVEALRALDADIQYVEQEGFLPLRIIGKPLAGGKVTLDMTQSSQFASSLVMAAPMFPDGLELELVGDLGSLPYLDMTLSMMCHFSAQAERQGRRVVVQPKPYQPKPFAIEPDWTAASYWYEMAAFSEECEIRLKGLGGPSTLRQAQGSGTACLQGDAIIAEWMAQLGVGTFAEGDDLVLRKIPFEKHPLHFDFSQHPDLYPTMAATCAGLHLEAHFTGLDNLAVKESNRVEAMQTELSKLDQQPLQFCTHNDHRIAMALAPLSMLYGTATFDHPEVVEKSYPNFWKDASFLPIF
jgi:3-phosphoshikimate 1-carboxyvinyltransferase